MDMVQTTWAPSKGPEIQRLLDSKRLSSEEKDRLVDETIRILSKCGSPNLPSHSNVGLVFGYVQSGKTLSFTALTALAKDNGYKIIVVLAGVKNNLLHQSSTRLKSDLGIETQTESQWMFFENPTIKNKPQIDSTLKNWSDANYPQNEHRTILITVLKNGSPLKKLIALIEKLNMTGVANSNYR